MKTNKNRLSQKSTKRTVRLMTAAALLVSAGWATSCQDTYDLDEKLPPNFGWNLMTYLEDNNFTTYSRLAKDLNYVDALSGVSLKTLLAADDEAFDRFFKNNNWGVSRYEDLSVAQKKMLFYNSMLDNSLQVLNLSSTSGEQEATAGNAMRRSASGSIYDSVPIITPDEMPDNNPNWDYYRLNGKSMVCMKDMTTKPILFFIEPFLKSKRITDDDINFLYNYTFERKTGDATVGSTYITEGNIRCPNGFIHRTNDVLVPLDNMAEVIRRNKNTQIFSRILERFSAPYYAGVEATRSYNLEYGTEIDSLFEKRYFALRSKGGEVNKKKPNNGPEVSEDELLRFDPGWNSFFSDQKGAVSSTVSMQSNMGVMLVPTDSAMEAYWNGAGAVIRDFYHEWDNVPNHIWAELINNGMLNSWVNSVPSKFDGIVNSNQDRMGIEKDSIKSVELACNGAIYLTKKVYAPTSFISVSFPSLVNENMSIFRWAIQRLEYRSYLNSLDSYYSFFIPTNKALMVYYDPLAYPGKQNQLWKFHYKENAETEDERVWASVFQYDLSTNTIGDSIGEVRDPGQIADRLEDLLDTHIIIGNKKLGGVENGHDYYRTKDGGVIAVKKEGNDLYVQGTFQRDNNKWLKVSKIYDQTLSGGNGKAYILDEDPANPDQAEPIMTTRKSTFDILSEHEEFSFFYELMEGSTLLESVRNNLHPASDAGNISAFNNFNYTVYVPTNESLKEIFDNPNKYGLYTWKDIAAFKDMIDSDPSLEDKVKKMEDDLEAFLRYHIQDNLLMIGLDYANDGAAEFDENGHPLGGSDTFVRNFETASTYLTNNETIKFRMVEVHNTRDDITIKDAMGNTRKVLKQNDSLGQPLYNLTAREYQLDWSISASSHAAIHLIDGPLLYK